MSIKKKAAAKKTRKAVAKPSRAGRAATKVRRLESSPGRASAESTKVARKAQTAVAPLSSKAAKLRQLAAVLPKAIFVDDLDKSLRPSVIVQEQYAQLLPPIFRDQAIPVQVIVPVVDGSVMFVTDTNPPFAILERYCFVAPGECASKPPNGNQVWCAEYGEITKTTPVYDSRPPIVWKFGASKAQKSMLRLLYSRQTWWDKAADEQLRELFRLEKRRSFHSLSFDAPKLVDGNGHYSSVIGMYNPGQLGIFPTHVTRDEDGEEVFLQQSLFRASFKPSKGYSQLTEEEKKDCGDGPLDLFFPVAIVPSPASLENSNIWHRSSIEYCENSKIVRSAVSGVFFFAADFSYHNSSWLSAMRPLTTTPVKDAKKLVHKDITLELGPYLEMIRERLAAAGIEPTELAGVEAKSRLERGSDPHSDGRWFAKTASRADASLLASGPLQLAEKSDTQEVGGESGENRGLAPLIPLTARKKKS